MFAATVVGPVPLASPQAVSVATSERQESGLRSEPGQAARSNPAPGHESPRDAETGAAQRATESDAARQPGAETLTEAELRQVEQMKVTDQEIRRHELAHQVAGGAYTGAPSYAYERGPDGERYVVAGEVPIDYGPVQGDPRATIDKMQQVISAALAPADPSPKDHQVAARARGYMMAAQLEMAQQQGELEGARGASRTSEASTPASQADGDTSHRVAGTVQATPSATTTSATTTSAAAEGTASVALSQYDVIARAANVGARESLRSLA